MADNEDLGLGPEDQLDSLDDTNGINDETLLNDTDGDGAGGDDPELEAIKARVREMEEEAEKLKQLQTEVDKQMNMGSPPGLSPRGNFKRQQSENGVNAISKCQNGMGQEERTTPQHQAKLKSLYKTAKSQAEQEEEILRDALQKIAEIRNIKNERRIQARLAGNKETIHKGPWMMKMLHSSAQTLPLFVGKIGEKPPPLCGAISAESSYYAKVGDMVAALVEVTGHGEKWILAEVVSFNHATNKYEVDDILEEENQKKRHTLSKKRVVPLPLMRANPETDPSALFPQGTVVMALYPQTTCFYKALVNKLPVTHMDGYEVLFEDTSYPNDYSPPFLIAQRYVIAIKQKSKLS